MSSLTLDTARQQWQEGHRRFQEEARDPERRFCLLAYLETVSDELRKRLGTTFTLAELVEDYARADDWVRDVLAEIRIARVGT